MDAKTCIKTRRSVRKFTDEAVTNEQICELVELASYSPSWKNTQTARYIAITDSELKSRISKECCAEFNQKNIDGAPVVIATLIVDKRSGYERDGSFSTVRNENWQAFDNGMAAQTLCLAAHDMGLGTVVMGLYDIEKASEILEVPEGQLLMALIAVGHPADEPVMPKRKSVEDLLTIR